MYPIALAPARALMKSTTHAHRTNLKLEGGFEPPELPPPPQSSPGIACVSSSHVHE